MTTTVFQAATATTILLSFLLFCSHDAAAAFTVASASTIAKGSKIPPVELHWGFNPITKVFLPQYIADKKVLIVSTVGAFVPSETARIRTYLENQDQLAKELGIDNVVVYSVNDGAVVGLWNQALLKDFESSSAAKKKNKLITFFGDPSGEFTRACGMLSEDDRELGLVGRSKPFVLCVENNVVSHVLDDSGSHSNSENKFHQDVTSASGVIEALKRREQTSIKFGSATDAASSSAAYERDNATVQSGTN